MHSTDRLQHVVGSNTMTNPVSDSRTVNTELLRSQEMQEMQRQPHHRTELGDERDEYLGLDEYNYELRGIKTSSFHPYQPLAGPNDQDAIASPLEQPLARSRGNEESQDTDSLKRPHVTDRYRTWARLCTCLKPWSLQISAAALSTAALVSLAVIGATFENRPSSSWRASMLSINAVVAAVTTVMKTALGMAIADCISQGKWVWFSAKPGWDELEQQGKSLKDISRLDDASRGSWGSLLWLIKTKSYPHLVSFGALLMIASLAFDTFSQQFVHTGGRLATDSSLAEAHVPWAQNVSDMSTVAWYAALSDGLFSPSISDIPANCPTGNCTWPIIPSVGMCGHCLDITDKMPDNWMVCGDKSDNVWNQAQCNYTVPGKHYYPERRSGTTLVNAPAPRSTWKSFIGAQPTTYLYTTASNIGVGYINNSLDLPVMPQSSNEYGTYCFDFVDVPILHREPEEGTSNSQWKIEFGSPKVIECSLQPCMQAYNISIVAGRQMQTTALAQKGTFHQRTRYNPSPVVELEFDAVPEYNMAIPPEAFRLQPNLLTAAMGDDLLYTDSYNAYISLFSGLRWDPPIVKAYRSAGDDMTSWIERVAKSLSNAIRIQNDQTTRGAGRDPYAGIVLSEQTYIIVSWPWLAYPILMVLGGWLFLLASIVQSKRAEVEIWKAGQIPLLLSTVDSEINNAAQEGHMAPDGAVDDYMSGMKVLFRGAKSYGWAIQRN